MIISIYKKQEKMINYAAKFLILFYVFSKVNSFVEGTPINNILVNLGLAIISLILAPKWIVLLMMLTVTGQIFLVSAETAILIFTLMLIIYLSFARLFPKLSLFIIAVPLCFYFKVPLVIPLVAGLFLGLETIIPITIGVLVHYSTSFVSSILNTKAEDLFDIPIVIFDILTRYLTYLLDNREFLTTVILFLGVIVITYILKRLSIQYATHIAIISGSLLYVIGMIMSIFIMDLELNPLIIFIQAILALAIVFIIQFFKVVLNYPRSETVQFEDDDYYYYVKAVPKIKYNLSKKQIKRITDIEKDH